MSFSFFISSSKKVVLRSSFRAGTATSDSYTSRSSRPRFNIVDSAVNGRSFPSVIVGCRPSARLVGPSPIVGPHRLRSGRTVRSRADALRGRTPGRRRFPSARHRLPIFTLRPSFYGPRLIFPYSEVRYFGRSGYRGLNYAVRFARL